jgi:hypothetical protein
MTHEYPEWDEDAVLGLVANKAQESFTLDFKACDALTNKGWKHELAKDVSAFANSAGGTLVYGLRENSGTHEAESIDQGYDPAEVSKERLEQVINSTIHRRIDGIRYYAVALNKVNPGRVLYVIEVPESARAPHMANHRFYKRFEFESLPMEEYEVRERYRRETYPSKDIIRAWFDDAINPLIGYLELEEECLRNEHWTWDRGGNAFGGLNSRADVTNHSANQEDFMGRHDVIKDGLLDHDGAIMALNAEGAAFCEAVGASTVLRDMFRRATGEDSLMALKAEYPHYFKGTTGDEILAEVFSSDMSEPERLVWLAEHIINRTQTIQNQPVLYFWKKNREEFARVLEASPLSENRARVVMAREKLSRIDQELIASLKKSRKNLSEQHGVPFKESRQTLVEPYGWGLGGPGRFNL